MNAFYAQFAVPTTMFTHIPGFLSVNLIDQDHHCPRECPTVTVD
jgi:hypothetical protein